jgi:signal transduction histidine kinase
MKSRLITRSVLAPAVFLSMLVLAVGVVAARYVQELQRSNADVMAREVSSMLAAEDLNVCMREFRHQLNLFLRDGDGRHLQAIPGLRTEAQSLLAKAERLSRADHERELIEVVKRGANAFFKEYDRISDPAFPGDFRAATVKLLEEQLDRDVLTPARAYVDFSRQVVEGTSRESQALANHIRVGLILLGASGAVGGLMAGFGIALAISRSIVQLQVPIRGAAGKLNEVVGPVTFSVGNGLDGVNQMLEQMSQHIATVVERLQQREREVLRAEHLAAVGQLAAGLAHELRNPLMPIKILVQAASDQGNGAGLHGRDLAVIEQEITRLEQSIQDFLDFARPPEPEKTEFDLRPVVQQMLDLLSARADRQHVRLHGKLPDEVVAVVADRGQLRQVLVNLVLNALDALPEGGEIDVSLQVERTGKPTMDGRVGDISDKSGDGQPCSNGSVLMSRQFPRQSLVRSARLADREELLRRGLLPGMLGGSPEMGPRQIVLRVGDDGPGIDRQILPRVFHPFVSTKETGTGLGLSICRRIIEAHGGTIEARNRPGGGAEFVCRLPPAAPDRPLSQSPLTPSAAR